MTFSLKTKFLLVCIFLVLVTAVSLSITYYVRTQRFIHQQSRQHIRIAFDIILDDLTEQMQTYATKCQNFLEQDTRLNGAVYLYFQDEDRLSSVRSIAFNLTNVVNELRKAEQILSFDRLVLYGPDKRLMVLYQRDETRETIGGYVVSQTGKDTYLPMDEPDIQTRLLDGQPIADMPLPSEIAAQYSGEFPVDLSTEMFSTGNRIGFRIIAPVSVSYIETPIGVLIGEVMYTQNMFERYATLSDTGINLFGKDRLILGTLPAQAPLEPDIIEQLPPCMAFFRQDTDMDVVSLTYDEHRYYQGQCSLTSNQGTVGVITVSLSQDIEIREIQKMLFAVLVISGIVLGIAFGLSFFFSRKFSQSIHNIITVISAVADGDLQTRAKIINRDESGLLAVKLNQMVEHLRTIVEHVQRSGIQVTSSATELSATAREQETIMAHQVESAAKVVNSVKEISDVAMHLVETVQHVSSMSQDAAGFADRSQTDLLNMEEAMRHMEDASKSISGRLQTISEKAGNITTVVTTINKVAEQTNLLSLNASIEAEKAGEYGRGFTVVAREIRRLADQTAVATLDIGQMVQAMQSAVSSGIMEMDKFIAEVRHNAEDVGKISMQLSLIIDQVQALTPNFEEVTVSMAHQSENAQKIKNEITSLSDELHQTKDSLHETYAVIEQLNEAAKGLKNQVSRFKVH